MSNIVIKVNGSSTSDGFLLAPDAGSTFPVPLNLSTNDGTTVSATVDATPNGGGISLPGGTISIGPAGTTLAIHATTASAARGDTVINVHVGAVTTSFSLTAILEPELWFRGRFEARFATDEDWYNDPRGTWGAGNDGVNPLGHDAGSGPPGWTWVLEGEPDFVPADSAATDPYKPVGRVVRFNNAVAPRSHAAPVGTTVNEIHGKLAGAATQIFTTGDPVIGATVNLGPNTYLAANDPARPGDPTPSETYGAGLEVLALFELHVDGYFSGASAALTDRPKSSAFTSPLPDADEKAAIGWVNLTTFNASRLALLQNDYNALSPADRTGTVAGRNLNRRIGHLTGAGGRPGTLGAGWDGKEEYSGQVNASLGFQPQSSSVVSYFGGFTAFAFFARLFAFHSDELCGYVHGSLKANAAHRVVKDCVFITDRSTFSKDEVAAMLHLASPAVIPAAFYVHADGFRPGDLGITAADLVGVPSISPTITRAPAVGGMTIGDSLGRPSALLAEDSSLPAIPQRFTWVYPITFSDTTGFVPGGQVVNLAAAIGGVSGAAQIQLLDVANVYEVDGPVSWLSTDTRVFMARAGEHWFNAPALGTTTAAASTFIKAIISNLNTGSTGGQTFDSLDPTENGSALALYQADHTSTAVFNFALSRVRYRALLGPDPTNVRVFFRLCPALSVSVDYDPATTYRRSPVANPDGQPIPVLGVQGGHVVTIPFFAEERKNASLETMEHQIDPANVQVVVHDPSGAEVEAYFGCVLDINQPTQSYYPLNPVGDGPYAGGLKSVFELVRNDHQCLLTEIVFDPAPITGTPSPATSDKLAQRNLSTVPSDNPGAPGSRRIPNTFELKPTSRKLRAGDAPDELLIDWGNTPAGSTAQIYLPTVASAEILKMAERTSPAHALRAVDAHTIECRAHGITYVPIPPGSDVNHAGLLTVDLPAGVRRGQLFKIVVRQVTNTAGVPQRRPDLNHGAVPEARGAGAAVAVPEIRWRRVRGSFQISIPVGSAEALLGAEETKLSILRYIGKSIPSHDRWHPVFTRYLSQLSERVGGFGGDPGKILPSPIGQWRHPGRLKGGAGERRIAHTGKVSGLVYDRFGDFEGFWLDTEDGERRFCCKEPELESVVRRAWTDRISTRVFVEADEPHEPTTIVLLAPAPRVRP
jgi:hypothetical protein